jgi:hypothetical protein
LAKIFVLNGVNLAGLGQRRPEVYGTLTLNDIEKLLRDEFSGVELEFRQTDHEGEMVGFVREAAESAGLAINPLFLRPPRCFRDGRCTEGRGSSLERPYEGGVAAPLGCIAGGRCDRRWYGSIWLQGRRRLYSVPGR